MTKNILLSALGLRAQNGVDPTISDITVDSRDVKPGSLFAALPGTTVHGASFFSTAVAQGAAAILTDADGLEILGDTKATSDVAIVVAQDPRQTLAQTASIWSGAHPETVIAVTGTNGKTSVFNVCETDMGRAWACRCKPWDDGR